MKLLLLLLTAYAAADRVLVLVDNMSIRETHSIFFKSISDRGHSVTFKNADEGSLQLIKFDELQYENLVLFAPSADEFGGTITAAEIARFVDQGGNVLLAGSGSNVGSAVTAVAADNGFEFADQLIDHVNYDSILDDGSHTTVVASAESQLVNAPSIVGDRSKIGPILYSGGALVSSPNNRLRLDVFKASSTAYSHDPSKAIKEYPSAFGRQAVLVSAVQARNGARLVLTASLQLFSNEFISATVTKGGEKPVQSGNKAFVDAMAKWVLRESGVLRVKSVDHQKEDVDYKIKVEEAKEETKKVRITEDGNREEKEGGGGIPVFTIIFVCVLVLSLLFILILAVIMKRRNPHNSNRIDEEADLTYQRLANCSNVWSVLNVTIDGAGRIIRSAEDAPSPLIEL